MSEPSDADKIRSKRLAKLQGPSSASTGEQRELAESSQARPVSRTDSPGTTDDGSRDASEAPAALEVVEAKTSAAAASSSGHPSTSLGGKPVNNTRKIVITSARAPSDSLKRKSGPSLPTESPEKNTPKRPSSAAGTGRDPLEAWEERTLRAIFRVTLDLQQEQHDAHGEPLLPLPITRAELEEQDGRPRLSVAVLDQVLLEAASDAAKKSTPLQYLLGCWKRVVRAARNYRSTGPDDPKLRILQEARRLCMSYCIFAATIPDMFGLESTNENPLIPHLLVDPDNDHGICHDFLSEAVRRFGEDETIRDALVDAIEEISRRLGGMTMADNYKPYVLAVQNAVHYAPLATALAKRPFFLPKKIAAPKIERETLLGPLFHISPVHGQVASEYFVSPKTKDERTIASIQNALRMSLHAHQADLFGIVNSILRASKEARDRVLEWFALTVNANHKRRSMRIDDRLISSDGFMINVTICLDQLCEPFMDATFSKIDRIEVDYFRRKPRIDIRDETKLNADQETADQFYSTTVAGTNNFISEVFFLTLAAHHYGTEATVTKLAQLVKNLGYLEKQKKRFEEERERYVNTPHLAAYEAQMKRYHDQIEAGLTYKLAVEGILKDELAQARSMQFMRYVMVWLLRLVDPRHAYPSQPIQLPLPSDEPDVLKCLPEYIFEDIVSTFKFIFRHIPQVMTSTQCDELVVFCITFLRTSEYIKNPYLKSGLVTIFCYGTWPTPNSRKGVLGDTLNGLPFATEHLLHAILKFYIEVETTGTHTQFFDKFHIRFEIFQVIKCIWTNTIYRERLSQEAEQNLDFFVRFVNLLLNDVTWVLDESLRAFGKIHQLQIDLLDQELAANDRTQKEEELATAEAQARSYMQLTNETVAMLKLFTEALADSFTMPEIVQRLADMLDYNVEAMVGPKKSNLKVENPEQYGFRPRVLLSELVDVYLNLSGKTAFVEAVARDGRSYKPENFESARHILTKWGLKSSEELAAWGRLAERIKQAKEADDQEEADLGEIPEDFLDPVMFSLMEDPVILPTSNVSVDRSTIRSHLLSDPNDPFNRVPLAIEDVKPNVELKAKIQAFKAERKAAKLASTSDAMDTSSG
ncbi:MAG: Aminolevulinate dehydratase [Watsoniomyces obsoletus]|nr:MAG: Aminolevulinate dehydratase [Watsoniomyces obsoletus]